jgi:hypothetical protein
LLRQGIKPGDDGPAGQDEAKQRAGQGDPHGQ